MTLYQILAAVLFSVGMYGVLSRKNLITVLMAMEIMLNAASISLVDFSVRTPNNEAGQIMVLFVLAVAAVEVALGLTLVILLFRHFRTISIEEADTLHN